MKQLHKLFLMGLSMIPLQGISVAAQSHLSLIQDNTVTAERLSEEANGEMQTVVQLLHQRGLIDTNHRRMVPPEPSIHA